MSDPSTASPRGGSRASVVLVALLIAGVGLLADILTKKWAVAELSDGRTVSVWGELIRFTLTYNPGAAFSAGTRFTPFISAFALLAAIAVLVVILRTRAWVWGVTLGLLLAGILGNLNDRIFQPPAPMKGHVIDFIMLPNWPVFNLADILINVAGVSAFILVLRGVPLREAPDGQSDQVTQSEA
jgi:signal peptidase II